MFNAVTYWKCINKRKKTYLSSIKTSSEIDLLEKKNFQYEKATKYRFFELKKARISFHSGECELLKEN